MKPHLPTQQLTFAVETFADFQHDALDAGELHWQEVAKDKHLLQLNLDMDYYEAAERNGHLLVIIARTRGSWRDTCCGR